MYKNVVVGIDGMQGGRDAAALAASLGAADARTVLVHVADVSEQDRARELLERERGEAGIEAELLTIAAPSVAAGLHEAAASHAADLIVVGSSHHHGLGRLWAGDDALATLHGAPSPVAVAPAGYGEAPRSVRRIGVAYDGSSESKVALAGARELATGLRAKVVAHYVAQEPLYVGVEAWASASAIAETSAAEIDAARERLGPLDGAELEVVVGLVRDDLEAWSERVDVLVCGSRGHGTLGRVMLGSTSDYLARHARCPLVVTMVATEGGAPATPPSEVQ
jgi:nucleotide-binding universal stress UspA family protein